MTYLVLKRGVYDQGVYHVGEDEKVAIDKCNEFAKNDRDNHHEWVVVSFKEPADSDEYPEHEVIHVINKREATSNNLDWDVDAESKVAGNVIIVNQSF